SLIPPLETHRLAYRYPLEAFGDIITPGASVGTRRPDAALQRSQGMSYAREPDPVQSLLPKSRRAYRSDMPPPLRDPEAVQIQTRQQRSVGHLGGVGRDKGGKHDDDRSIVIVHELLTLRVHVGSLFLVKFRAGRRQEVVEAGILPECVVLIRVRGILEGHRLIRGRPAEPLAGTERLLLPDVVPITVVRLPNNGDVDPSLRCALAEDGRRVD